MKRFIDMEHAVTFVYVFAFINLVSVQSVIHTANEYSIYHFRILLKDFSISFSRAIIVQDFETVNFYVQADLLCYLLLNKKVAHFKSIQ